MRANKHTDLVIPPFRTLRVLRGTIYPRFLDHMSLPPLNVAIAMTVSGNDFNDHSSPDMPL